MGCDEVSIMRCSRLGQASERADWFRESEAELRLLCLFLERSSLYNLWLSTEKRGSFLGWSGLADGT